MCVRVGWLVWWLAQPHNKHGVGASSVVPHAQKSVSQYSRLFVGPPSLRPSLGPSLTSTTARARSMVLRFSVLLSLLSLHVLFLYRVVSISKKKKEQSILTLPRVPARVSSTDAPGLRKLRRGPCRLNIKFRSWCRSKYGVWPLLKRGHDTSLPPSYVPPSSKGIFFSKRCELCSVTRHASQRIRERSRKRRF